jgi:hypothetical protein
VQTSIQRPARTRKFTAELYSIAATRLIEQIQAEAREKLLEELSAKDAIIVLHGFDAATKTVRVNSHSVAIRDRKGNETTFYRRYLPPESWVNDVHMDGYWHPARWYGDQTMVDSSGAEWSRSLGVFVCDDFGNLVQVAA